MKRLASNASIFERRGDPWVSDKDAVRDFGRHPLTEDPDMDQFTRASRSRPPDESRAKSSIFGKATKPKPSESLTDERRILNVRIKMQREILKASRARQAIKLPDRQGDFRPRSIFDKK